MLAYTAVDGLRAISRDFDLDWQPEVNADIAIPGHDWRNSRRTGRRILNAVALLLPFSEAALLR